MPISLRRGLARREGRRPWRAIAVTLLLALIAGGIGVLVGARVSAPDCVEPGPELVGQKEFEAPPCFFIERRGSYIVSMETTAGPLGLRMIPQVAPATVNNFIFLSLMGFYDGLTFHRIEATDSYAYVQTGDPTGQGGGGPGYTFEGEVPSPITKYVRGTVAMLNQNDPSTNGSQFFVIVRDWDQLGLPETTPRYTFFGFVDDPISMSTLDRLVSLPREGTRPIQPIVIERVTVELLREGGIVLEIGPDGRPIDEPSPRPSPSPDEPASPEPSPHHTGTLAPSPSPRESDEIETR